MEINQKPKVWFSAVQIYGATQIHVINLKTWNKLPENLKVALESATKAHTKRMAEQMYIDNITDEKTGNFKMVELSDELKETMWAAAVKSRDSAAKTSPRAAEAVELLKEWNRPHGHFK